MSSLSTGGVEEHPADPVPRTLLLAGCGVVALGGIGVLAGAPPVFVVGMVLAPVVGAVHVAGLTVPGLLVAQASFGLAGSPSTTTRAIVAGLRDGTALLLASLPLVLFFGASIGDLRTVLILSYVAGELALGATLIRAWRLLIAGENQLGITICTVWALLAGATATVSAADVLSALGGAP